MLFSFYSTSPVQPNEAEWPELPPEASCSLVGLPGLNFSNLAQTGIKYSSSFLINARLNGSEEYHTEDRAGELCPWLCAAAHRQQPLGSKTVVPVRRELTWLIFLPENRQRCYCKP